jgi:hypothetical protein
MTELALHAEELEPLDALDWDWGHFIAGTIFGAGLVATVITVAGIAIT